MYGSLSTTPVGDTAGVEGGIAGSHTHQSQLVREEGDVGRGGGERVDKGEGGWRYDRIDTPFVEGHGWVGLVGAVESGVRTNRCSNARVINTHTVYDWRTCRQTCREREGGGGE